MRVSLPYKMKPDSYTESCAVNAADGWRERNVWYPREVCTERSEKSNRYRKITLNVQKSAEAIVAGSFFFRRRAESIGVLSTTRKGGMGRWVQKTEKAAHKEIARNAKGM